MASLLSQEHQLDANMCTLTSCILIPSADLVKSTNFRGWGYREVMVHKLQLKLIWRADKPDRYLDYDDFNTDCWNQVERCMQVALV